MNRNKESRSRMIDNRLSSMITATLRYPRSDRKRGRVGAQPAALMLAAGVAVLLLIVLGQTWAASDHEQAPSGSQKQAEPSAGARSTQPSIDRQLDAPGSSSAAAIVSAPSVAGQVASGGAKESALLSSAPRASNEIQSGGKQAKSKPQQVAQQQTAQQKKYAASQQQNYDKYQLKATNSQGGAPSVSSSGPGLESAAPAAAKGSGAKEGSSRKDWEADAGKQASPAAADAPGESSTNGIVSKNSRTQQQQQQQHNKVKTSSFALLKKLLPSFMSSAGPAAAAAAAAAASAMVDKHQVSRSRSSPADASSLSVGQAIGSYTGSADGALGRASGKLIKYILGASKKSAAVPDHAPFFVRKPNIDRQAGFASGLLSNPLSLGLLFSAPLIPSLLLTPLAIAGLSPAMSAINNFFADDEEASASTPASSPLSILTGPSSALSSILQGSSSPFLQAAASSSSSSSSNSNSNSNSISNSNDSPRSSLALQAVQSFLGPTSTTEKPLFNPGMFASQGIQNAMANLNSASAPSQQSSNNNNNNNNNNSPIKSLLGANFIQTAASMISPSFAAPPASSSAASSSSADSDDGPGLMEMASSVFDKVSSYMNTDKDSIATAASNQNAQSSSALSSLVGLSSFSPFQLSSLFASSPIASALTSSPGSSGHNAPTQQRAGFFSTLKNVYELFSSSFLRRQADVGDSNECQQRLICELHQRAMNSKLFRRSVQANLMELASLDRNLLEQIKSSPMQARVDADTKAMLNDFLKATNSFRSGHDVVDCSKMFPKCSRAMLLSTANLHLMDPKNGKAIGKFSNFMKKMKFKSNQQHQSQWKLRKPGKAFSVQPLVPTGQYQATDYLQVAPLTTVAVGGKPPVGQLSPVDSLKLVQQIMLMSQQVQQQQQQQKPNQGLVQAQSGQAMSTSASDSPQSYIYPAAGSDRNQAAGSSQVLAAPNQMTNYLNNYAQQQQQYPSQSSTSNNGQLAMTNFYTDSIPQMYSSSSPTNSPYYTQSQSFAAPEQNRYQTQYNSAAPGQQQQEQSPMQQLQSYQQYQQVPTASQIVSEADKKLQQQQQSMTSQQVKPVSGPAVAAA